MSRSLATLLTTLPVPRLPLPPRARISATFFHFFEITAIVLGALGGALYVRRDRGARFDFIGILGLGLLSGVGGGIIRDVLIGDGPPVSLTHPAYLAYALLGAAGAILFGRAVGVRMLAFMNVVDALALGFFTVAGCSRGQNFDLGFLPSLLMGVITAVGGGSLRDLFSGKPPAVFQEGELYALVSAITAAVFLGLQRVGVRPDHAAALGTLLGFSLRMLAVRYGWRTRALDVLH